MARTTLASMKVVMDETVEAGAGGARGRAAAVMGALPTPSTSAVLRTTEGAAEPAVRAVRPDVPLVADDATPSRAAAWLLLVPTALLIGLPFVLHAAPFALWLSLAGCMVAFFVLFGWASSGHWNGIFLGTTKSWSLSITQALLWSCLILPALVAAFANRLASNPTDALAIGFDPELAWLMGLPAAGLAGSKIISANKGNSTKEVRGLATKQVNYASAHIHHLWDDYAAHHASGLGDGPARRLPKPTIDASYRNTFRGALRQALAAPSGTSPAAAGTLPPAPAGVVALAGRSSEQALAGPEAFAAWSAAYLRHNTSGLLVCNHRASEASLRDLVEGDEIGDEARTDFGKAQFLVVTLVCLAAYAVAVGWMFLNLPEGCGGAGQPCITALPPASQAIPAVLLASLLAYLGFKAAPSTPTT